MRGSLVTLECVSPALGILLVHEEEMRRRMVRRGTHPDIAVARIAAIREHVLELATGSRQRIEVWSFARLARRYQAATGARSLHAA
jgi:hypothetical protein